MFRLAFAQLPCSMSRQSCLSVLVSQKYSDRFLNICLNTSRSHAFNSHCAAPNKLPSSLTVKLHIAPLGVAEVFFCFSHFEERLISATHSGLSPIQTPRHCNYCTPLKDLHIYIIDSFIKARLTISLIHNLLCRMDFFFFNAG